jgi:Ca2+-transporting ATPase
MGFQMGSRFDRFAQRHANAQNQAQATQKPFQALGFIGQTTPPPETSAQPNTPSPVPAVFSKNTLVEAPQASGPLHTQTLDQCLVFLSTTTGGLSDVEVLKRQKQYGHNCLKPQRLSNKAKNQWAQLRSPRLVLLVGLAISLMLQGQSVPAIGILALGLGVQFLAIGMQSKIRHRNQTPPPVTSKHCAVRRGQLQQNIATEDLVPGDIVILTNGQTVPADARLLHSHELQVDESFLTGETSLVTKDANAQHVGHEELSRLRNMVFAGTLVKTGTAEAVVTAIGAQTVMGQILSLTHSTTRLETPLMQWVRQLNHGLFWTACCVAALVCLAQGVFGYQGLGGMLSPVGSTAAPSGWLPWLTLVQYAMVLPLIAVPDLLAILIPWAFSVGQQRLKDCQVVVKHPQVLESLGGLSVICTDKTGTLTENSLTLHEIFVPDLGNMPYQAAWADGQNIPTASVETMLRIARLNNTTVMEGIRGAFSGDPVEIALYRSAPGHLASGFRCLKEFPFDPQTMRMATIQQTRLSEGSLATVAYIKGAPERILEDCTSYMTANGEIAPLDHARRNEFLLANRELSLEKAYRIIGFAQKILPTGYNPDNTPFSETTFVGWVCLVDPPKPGVHAFIATAKQLGLRILMITGDQPSTAAITAGALGITDDHDGIWTAKQLQPQFTDTGSKTKAPLVIPKNITVFARTKPEEKLRVVEALQQSGEQVAMVGDGMNDAPALKQSNVGIAMGVAGAEGAKESADLLLLNDRLEGVLEAILESRYLAHTVDEVIQFGISGSLGLLLLAGLTGLLPTGAGLVPVQLLWLNVLMIGLPAMWMVFQHGETEPNPDRLTKPLVPQSLSKTRMSATTFWALCVMFAGLITYGVGHWVLSSSVATMQTMVWLTTGWMLVLNLLNVRYSRSEESLNTFLLDTFGNVRMLGTLLGALGVLLTLVYIPGLNLVVMTCPLSPIELLCALGSGLIGTLAGLTLLDKQQFNEI